ncbi:hypothetical protein E3P86_00923 [Wallemia ichthyophaga]|uniref:Uncharacterized protein n=1 Tax=Wallemia ichthyophaga TaxID=245174 RepID=A0A4T0JAA6_WALIC|nr:hypothetical protein E3P86_00923 [Wallemia ichthyophaga]
MSLHAYSYSSYYTTCLSPSPSPSRPQSPPKKVKFSQNPPTIAPTWDKNQYDRSPESIPTTIQLGLSLPQTTTVSSKRTRSKKPNRSTTCSSQHTDSSFVSQSTWGISFDDTDCLGASYI